MHCPLSRSCRDGRLKAVSMAQSPIDADERGELSPARILEKAEQPLPKTFLNGDRTAELVDSSQQEEVRKGVSIKRGKGEEKEKEEQEEERKRVQQGGRRRPSPFMRIFSDSESSLPVYDSCESTPSPDYNLLSSISEEPHRRKAVGWRRNTSLYTKRLVEKNGSSNVIPRSSKRHRFLNDFYTTLSDLKWRYCLLILIAVNISTWILFAMVYYVIISIHMDVINHDNPEWDSCILNVNSFISSFLFSLETQNTIGYGFRAMKDICPVAVVVWKIQSLTHILIGGLFCGLIFAKLMSPQYRSKLIRFSRQAVISFNKGVPSFVFRLIDLKKSNLVNCTLKAVLIKEHVTKEGEFIPFYNRSLSLSIEETTGSDLFLLWPVNVSHVIDSQSPLHGLTPKKLQEEYLEIIVILEGVVENSGKLMQVRTSYISEEILWGASFSPLLNFNPKTKRYEMDYSNFDDTQLTLLPSYISTSKRYPHLDSVSRLIPCSEMLAEVEDPSHPGSTGNLIGSRTIYKRNDRIGRCQKSRKKM